MADTHILRIDDVSAMIGLSRSQIWRLTKTGDFPPPVKLGVKARGWKSADVDRWIRSREVAHPVQE